MFCKNGGPWEHGYHTGSSVTLLYKILVQWFCVKYLCRGVVEYTCAEVLWSILVQRCCGVYLCRGVVEYTCAEVLFKK